MVKITDASSQAGATRRMDAGWREKFSRGIGRIVLVVGAAVPLAACSPTFNWRDAPLDGAPLRVQLPCKPERAEREVPLGAQARVLRLMSCETAGHTFAVAWAPVQGGEDVPALLTAWQQAGWASLRQAVSTPSGVPAGWQPWAPMLARAQHVRAWQGSGLNHQGQALQARQLYFSDGAWVYQVAVYGDRLDAEALAAWVEGLQLPAKP